MTPGFYVAKADEWHLGVSSKGSEYIAVTFVIDEGDFKGQKILWKGYFTQKTSRRTIEALRYCGWNGANFCELNGLDRNQVQLDVGEDDYKGETYPKVQWVNQIKSEQGPMNDAQIKAFAERMNKVAADVVVEPAKQPSTPADDNRPQPHTDEDDMF